MPELDEELLEKIIENKKEQAIGGNYLAAQWLEERGLSAHFEEVMRRRAIDGDNDAISWLEKHGIITFPQPPQR